MIDVRDIDFAYPNGVPALRGVSLTLRRGERVALVGHNGSGKSTLAKHLNGLLHPSRGEVVVDGHSTHGRKVAKIAHSVALLFQNPDDQICKRSVWDEVIFGPQNLGIPQERIAMLGHEALRAFELLDMKEWNPHDLGFSRRKRLALASVVAMDTPVLVLDEPSAGLDPSEIALLEAVLDRLEAEGKTVLTISHDMDFVVENIDRAICLDNGTVAFDGSVVDLFEDHCLLDRSGLLLPQIAQLSQRMQVRPRKLTPDEFVRALSGRER
ncbi:ABC transporter ATP-binding protein [uncultured Pseudodesulfovibrio sp.]|uniref:energy-coupling factor ABC transporter ATP-binding protein n=1 Tax=uncultured Pseudodesulfovibrio sp. TaxID=2035858 RepID=UPI0029C647E8|nr:ABC transporter ATP-binding protein [uncultured Pseudodesulfovibrio sp.]